MSDDVTLLLVGLIMFVLGLLLSYLFYSHLLQQARRDIDRLELKLASEEKLHEERLQLLEDTQDRLHNVFAAASQRALRENNQQFLQLAQESMRRFHAESQSDLEQRRQAVQHLVEPIREALQKTEQQIQLMEKERQSAFGTLTEQLRQLGLDQMALRQETGKLSTALRTPGSRGQWGELSLKRIVEMAGMVEHCDFEEQVQRSNRERTIRPDMVVRMPDQRQLIIDAKAPMDAYLEAFETEQEQESQQHFVRHARSVREHVRILASKRYWEQFSDAPDFVVLFLPGESFLTTALEQDKRLLQDALDMRVILSTPTTLMALLRAVAFGWQQAVLTENATQIRDSATELHKRLSILTKHAGQLGKNLANSVEAYNNLLGSLERSVIPGVRRLSELGIDSGREALNPEALDVSPRTPAQPELPWETPEVMTKK